VCINRACHGGSKKGGREGGREGGKYHGKVQPQACFSEAHFPLLRIPFPGPIEACERLLPHGKGLSRTPLLALKKGGRESFSTSVEMEGAQGGGGAALPGRSHRDPVVGGIDIEGK